MAEESQNRVNGRFVAGHSENKGKKYKKAGPLVLSDGSSLSAEEVNKLIDEVVSADRFQEAVHQLWHRAEQGDVRAFEVVMARRWGRMPVAEIQKSILDASVMMEMAKLGMQFAQQANEMSTDASDNAQLSEAIDGQISSPPDA